MSDLSHSASIIWNALEAVVNWSNANQGVLALILFGTTLFLGWVSGIFTAIRRKPVLHVKLMPGPTFLCTFGTGQKHGDYDVHRTGIALYLNIANVGLGPTSIDNISVGYHWAISRLGLLWWKYRLGWFWLQHPTVSLDDFQIEIGNKIKGYPFLIQWSPLSGQSTETYLQPGQSTKGVIYFEQEDCYGACFPVAKNHIVRIKLSVVDSFGRRYLTRLKVPRVSLTEARKYNPSFGQTLSTMRGESEPVSLPTDENGNLLPPGSGVDAR